MDCGECSRSIGIVGELHQIAVDEVGPVPHQMREFGVALKEFERGVHHRAADILLPVAWPDHAPRLTASARFRAGRACVGPRDTLSLDAAVVDNSDRIALAPGSRYTRGSVYSLLRRPTRLLDARLTWKVHPEAVLTIDVSTQS